MNRIVGLSVVMFLIITKGFCLGKLENSYYRQIAINGDFSFVGKYPINDKEAKRGTCYKFSYNKDGKLEKIEYFTNGLIKQDDLYFGVATIKIDYSNNGAEKRTYYNYKGKLEQDVVSGVYAVRIRRNMEKNTVSLFNYDKGDHLIQDRYDVAHYLCYLNEEGKRIKSIRFNERGQRIEDAEGYYELQTIYDNDGNVKEQINYDEEGKKMFKKEHITSIRRSYNENGDVIKESYHGIDGALKLHTRLGVAMVKREYDDNGNLIEEKYYGIDQQPMERNEFNGYSYATIRYKYADSGELKKIVYLDIHNKEI